MRHLTVAVLPLVLLTALPAQAQMVTISPEQIGQIFCIGSLGNDMAPVEALLTPDLAAVIADAWVKNAQAESANPGDKPPLGDGIPWRSYPDYADGCTVTADGVFEADATSVTINYSFSEEPSANYSNVLQLQLAVIHEGMEPFWRIDDIELVDGGTLRSALAAAFAY